MYSTLYYRPILKKLEFSLHIFEKSPNIQFHENPSSGSRVVLCGRTDMKLKVAFRNFANAPKKVSTVIPRLTKMIRSGITFVSRNVFISAPGMVRPFMFAALC